MTILWRTLNRVQLYSCKATHLKWVSLRLQGAIFFFKCLYQTDCETHVASKQAMQIIMYVPVYDVHVLCTRLLVAYLNISSGSAMLPFILAHFTNPRLIRGIL